MDKYEEALFKYFGYHRFLGHQKEIVKSLDYKTDTIAVMATGSGKSVCFQIPAILASGLTIVVTPLISLMIDQVRELNKNHIDSAYLNSNMDDLEIKNFYLNLNRNKIIYVSPERLSNKRFINEIKKTHVSFLIVDEAHCMSMWGHDFRLSYLEIKTFIDSFNYPITKGAFTATANKEILKDIKVGLSLNNYNIFTSSSDRKNLYYEIVKTEMKYNWLVKFLSKHNQEKTLIYVLTQRETNYLTEKLTSIRFNVVSYHGGMEPESKTFNQNVFTKGVSNIMVATNAFGMGVNIKDINNVIIYELPLSIEDLAQQWGRAARKLDRGNCYFLFDKDDIKTAEWLIDSSENKEIRKEKYQKLDQIIAFAKVKSCLHEYLCSYFGYKGAKCKEMCINCLKNNK